MKRSHEQSPELFVVFTRIYLTIRLRARDFYEVITDKGKPESTITSQISKASNLIVLVESEMKHEILHKDIEKRELKAIFLRKKCARKRIVLLLAIYR